MKIQISKIKYPAEGEARHRWQNDNPKFKIFKTFYILICNFDFCLPAVLLRQAGALIFGLSIFIFLIILSFVNTYADIIYLKSGGKLEGKIIEATQEGYEIKIKSGKIVVKKEDVLNVEEKPVDLSRILSPREQYQERLSEAGPKDAEAHFQLGIFCFENNLIDDANNEFKKAKDLDVSYIQKVDKELIKIEELKRNLKKEEVKIADRKETQFKKEEYEFPEQPFNREGFTMFLDTLKDKDKKEEFLKNCFLKAKENEKQGYSDARINEAQKKLLNALDFYRVTSYSEEPSMRDYSKEAVNRLVKRLIEPEEGILNKPVGRLYDEIKEFLSTTSNEEAQGYCGRYFKMGKDLESQTEGLPANSEELKLKLRTTLNCYMIVYDFIKDAEVKKEALTSIKRCNKRLIAERQ